MFSLDGERDRVIAQGKKLICISLQQLHDCLTNARTHVLHHGVPRERVSVNERGARDGARAMREHGERHSNAEDHLYKRS